MNWLNKIPKKKNSLAYRIIDEEAVIIPLENQPKEGEQIDIFNLTGTSIWELIDGKNSVKDIAIKITAEYDIEYEKAQSQVKGFLSKLEQKKLIDFL